MFCLVVVEVLVFFDDEVVGFVVYVIDVDVLLFVVGYFFDFVDLNDLVWVFEVVVFCEFYFCDV